MSDATGVPRTTSDSVLFTTYNVLDLFADTSTRGRAHYAEIVEAIRALGTDVIALQEIRAPNEAVARQRLLQLGDDLEMDCQVPGREFGYASPAIGVGSHGYHVGLLWRPGIEPVPGSFNNRNHDFWHSLASVALDLGGRAVRHAVYHAPPFGRKMRFDQNELIVAFLARPAGGPPTLVGADWNGESADRVQDESTREWLLYEPGDPYAAAEWFGDMVYQCEWDYDSTGRRRHWVDRSAGEVLWAGGLHDAAAVLRSPWQPTTGHHPDDEHGVHGVRRRIDAIRVTSPVLGALRAHHVTNTELTRRASDHLPVTVDYVPSAITVAQSGTPADPSRSDH
jgi:endonuclease/exonuclease/phosphatase family metal-dependent hydrolase